MTLLEPSGGLFHKHVAVHLTRRHVCEIKVVPQLQGLHSNFKAKFYFALFNPLAVLLFLIDDERSAQLTIALLVVVYDQIQAGGVVHACAPPLLLDFLVVREGFRLATGAKVRLVFERNDASRVALWSFHLIKSGWKTMIDQ